MNAQYNMSTKEIEVGLRAIATVARSKAGHLPLYASKLLTVLKAHLGSNIELNKLSNIETESLASEIVDPWIRQQLIRILIVSAMVDMKPSKAQVKIIKDFAKALDVQEPGIRALDLYVRKAYLRLQLHLSIHGHLHPEVTKGAKEESRWGMLVVLARMLGLSENKTLANKYRRMLSYPEGTLGRSYADFIVASNFNFPGEKGNPVEYLAIHDLCHVLGGYGTEPVSELQAIAFQAGHLSDKAFNFILLGLFQFHLGFRVSPIVTGNLGQLDIELAFKALLKGARMNTDLTTGDWNIAEDLDRPIDEVRAKYNITSQRSKAVPYLALVG